MIPVISEDVKNCCNIIYSKLIAVIKRDENGEWRRLHNEELHSLYRSPNIVRVIKYKRLRWAGHVARMEESRSDFKILTGKPTGKRHLGGRKPRWEYSIRINVK